MFTIDTKVVRLAVSVVMLSSIAFLWWFFAPVGLTRYSP